MNHFNVGIIFPVFLRGGADKTKLHSQYKTDTHENTTHHNRISETFWLVSGRPMAPSMGDMGQGPLPHV